MFFQYHTSIWMFPQIPIRQKLKIERETEIETNCKYTILIFSLFWVKTYLVLTYKILVQKVTYYSKGFGKCSYFKTSITYYTVSTSARKCNFLLSFLDASDTSNCWNNNKSRIGGFLHSPMAIYIQTQFGISYISHLGFCSKVHKKWFAFYSSCILPLMENVFCYKYLAQKVPRIHSLITPILWLKWQFSGKKEYC